MRPFQSFDARIKSSHPVAQVLGRIFVISAALILASVSLTGCRTSFRDPDTYPATVQVINGMQDSAGIQANINDHRLSKTVAFDQSTGFYGISSGAYALDVNAIGGLADQPTQLLREGNFIVDDGKHYTGVAFGAPGSTLAPASLAIFDDKKPTDEQKQDMIKRGVASISVFNAAVGAKRLDITVSSIVTFKGVPYGKRSTALDLQAQPYEWGVASSGSGDNIYGQPVTLKFEPGKSYLLVVTGNINNNDIAITAFED